MPRLKASALAVRKANGEADKRTIYSIEGETGLRLYIEPSGARAWYYEYKTDGRKNRMHIGGADVVSLADARTQALELRRKIALGTDPKAEERAEKRAIKRAQFTFQRLLDRRENAHTHLKSLKERMKVLKKDAVPAIGDWPVEDITKRDIIEIIDGISDRGSRVHADRVAAYLSAIFNWGIDEELCSSNPAHRIRKRSHPQPRERVLSDDELIRLWLAIRSLGDNARSRSAFFNRSALLLALLTGQRRGEVISARRQDIDLDRALWTIPAERTKNSRTHILPLAPNCLRLLRATIKTGEGCEFLYPPAMITAEAPFLNPRTVSKTLERLCEDLGIDGVTMHCFRRTMATRMGDMGVAGDVISRILNHSPQDVTRRHYNHARMIDQMREALEWWETFIQRQVEKTQTA